MSGSTDPIADASRIALDTNALIYYLDGGSPFSGAVARLLRRSEDGELEIIVPALVEMELLVGPMRDDDRRSVDRIELLLDHLPNLEVAPIDRVAARTAARIRADHGLATPDALIVGVAVATGCECIVGNDRRCAERLHQPEYVLLERLLPDRDS